MFSLLMPSHLSYILHIYELYLKTDESLWIQEKIAHLPQSPPQTNSAELLTGGICLYQLISGK